MDNSYSFDLLQSQEKLFSYTFELFLWHTSELCRFDMMIKVSAQEFKADYIVLPESEMAFHSHYSEFIGGVLMFEKLEPLALHFRVHDSAFG
jgi:hypothetical protein